MKSLIFGGTGLLGSAIVRQNKESICISSKDFDATDQNETRKWFHKNKDLVNKSVAYLCCGKVAGIEGQNNELMLSENLKMLIFLIECLKNYQKEGTTIFYSSSCVYPKSLKIFNEDDFFKGELEPSNEGYAIAKLTIYKLIQYINNSLGRKQFITIIPSNLWGINDNWDLKTCHVLPAITQKIYIAKRNNKPFLEILGNPDTMREFVSSDDVALATDHILNKGSKFDTFNVGYGQDCKIKWVINRLVEKIGYKGEIIYTGKNVGQKKKLMNSSRLFTLGWKPSLNYDDMIDFLVGEVKLKFN